MMGVQTAEARLFYDFCLDNHVSSDHLLQSVTDTRPRWPLKPFYSWTGRPSIDPELMVRMLIVGYCMGIRSERRLHVTIPLAVVIATPSAAVVPLRLRPASRLSMRRVSAGVRKRPWPCPRSDLSNGT